jgi:hypothetical protein
LRIGGFYLEVGLLGGDFYRQLRFPFSALGLGLPGNLYQLKC